jgi:CheY-like chemotaxis protein
MKVVVFDDELSEAKASRHGHGPGPGTGHSALQPSFRNQSALELRYCPHADDAVAVVERERPDVVLMDYAMHGERNGAEAVVALCALRKQGGPSFFLVAISADSAANQRMLDAGADDAVPKTHVRGYLQQLLERRRLSDSERRF